MSGFTWQGVDLRPDHRRWRFWIAQGRDELPAVRKTSDLVPFRRGRLHKAGIADTRQLELRGYIQEPTLEAFQATKDMLKGLLDPELEAPGTLVDPQDDGTQRWIYAVPSSLMSKFGGAGTRILSIELEALDPYWYGSNGFITLDSDLLMDGGLFMDADATITINPTSGVYDYSFNTLGTADTTKVRLEIDGPSEETVTIGNVSIPGSPGFAYPPLTAGQTLVVDSGLRLVTLDGVNARAGLSIPPQNRHGEYIRVRPGSNTFHILGKPAEVRVSLLATYL